MAFTESGDASIRLKVLALDDDGLVRRVLEDLLAGEHDFRAVSTCAEFNEIVVGFNPDVLLLDLVLPDGDGLDICRELRKNGQFEKLFILMLTAADQKQYIERGYAAGANDYIRKPFVPFEVKSKILNCKKIIAYQNKLYSAFIINLNFQSACTGSTGLSRRTSTWPISTSSCVNSIRSTRSSIPDLSR